MTMNYFFFKDTNSFGSQLVTDGILSNRNFVSDLEPVILMMDNSGIFGSFDGIVRRPPFKMSDIETKSVK